MRIHLCLAKVLNVMEHDKKRIRLLAERMGLEPWKLQYRLDNKYANISLDQLAKITVYVAHEKNISHEEALASLFGIEPDEFWKLLVDCGKVIYVKGIRENKLFDDFDVSYTDEFLTATAVDCVQRACDPDNHPPVSSFEVCHAWNRDGSQHANARKEATSKYRNYLQLQGAKALFCVGSIKSNPLVDLVAENFARAKAFKSEDHVSTAAERSCPFYLKYRDCDPQPESCAAGMQLCVNTPGGAPGIYYEVTHGDQWKCVECNDNTDAALVFYSYNRSREQLDVALSGYSGRATACLADLLRKNEGDELWKPVHNGPKLLIGACIVKFSFHNGRKGPLIGETKYHSPNKTEIIPLSEDVIKLRLKPHGPTRSK